MEAVKKKTEAAFVSRLSTLEWVQEFKKYGFMDLDECKKIKDNYSAVIMRFFEGDVPMMLASADVVSGTKKREGLSEAFPANPFKYSFYAVPVLEKGSAVLEVPSVEFSVNKNSKNLEMTNEFMRFLLRTQELGILDNTYTQVRNAAYQVLIEKKTVDEAIANYGKY